MSQRRPKKKRQNTDVADAKKARCFIYECKVFDRAGKLVRIYTVRELLIRMGIALDLVTETLENGHVFSKERASVTHHRVCAVCDKDFTTTRANGRFCYDPCTRDVMKRNKIVVKRCVTFNVEFSTSRTRSLYCNNPCTWMQHRLAKSRAATRVRLTLE